MEQSDIELSLTCGCPVCTAQPPSEPCREPDGTPRTEPHTERWEAALFVQGVQNRQAQDAEDATAAHARADAWARGIAGVLYGG